MTVTALPQARHLTAVPAGPQVSESEPRMTFNLQISVAGSALPSEAAQVLRDIRELAEQVRQASGSATVTMSPVTTVASTLDANRDGGRGHGWPGAAEPGRDGTTAPDPHSTLWIEPASRTVVQAGSPVRLTRREFDLLLFLAEHPRRVFSRDQLLSQVWGYEWVGGSRTVDVHVRRLRIKLGGRGPVVRTVHGVGYRLEDDLDLRVIPAPQ